MTKIVLFIKKGGNKTGLSVVKTMDQKQKFPNREFLHTFVRE